MDVRSIFERNAERLNALYAGIDQYPRYNALAEAYRAKFNSEPECFVSAPGRTEVVGNHTDHQNGRVLAGAVNLDTVAAIAPNGTETVCLYSEGYDKPFVVDISDETIYENEKETTFSLIRGVASRLRQLDYDRDAAIRDAENAPRVPRIATFIRELKTGLCSRAPI